MEAACLCCGAEEWQPTWSGGDPFWGSTNHFFWRPILLKLVWECRSEAVKRQHVLKNMITIDSVPYRDHMAHVRSHQALVALQRMMIYSMDPGMYNVLILDVKDLASWFLQLCLMAGSSNCIHAASALQEIFFLGIRYHCRGNAP